MTFGSGASRICGKMKPVMYVCKRERLNAE